MATLLVSFKEQSKIYEITRDVTIIGRSAKCDITINDPAVSARHCLIANSGGGVISIIDLDSSNGVIFDNETVSNRVLCDGDRITIGETQILMLKDRVDAAEKRDVAEPEILDVEAVNIDEYSKKRKKKTRRLKTVRRQYARDLKNRKNTAGALLRIATEIAVITIISFVAVNALTKKPDKKTAGAGRADYQIEKTDDPLIRDKKSDAPPESPKRTIKKLSDVPATKTTATNSAPEAAKNSMRKGTRLPGTGETGEIGRYPDPVPPPAAKNTPRPEKPVDPPEKKASPKAKPAVVPQPKVLPGPTHDRLVENALAKGRKFLTRMQKADGSFDGLYSGKYPVGLTAIAALALLKSGMDPDDPAIEKAFAFLRKSSMNFSIVSTYDLVYVILAVEARYYNPVSVRRHAEKHAASEVIPEYRPRIRKNDRILATLAAGMLVRWQDGRGGWGYGATGRQGYTDCSCTQMSLLALSSARNIGLKVRKSVFSRSLKFWLNMQLAEDGKTSAFKVPAALLDGYRKKDHLPKKKRSDPGGTITTTAAEDEDDVIMGRIATALERRKSRKEFGARGWSYLPRTPATAGMTAAGLASVVICRNVLAEDSSFLKSRLRRYADRAIEDSAAWLALYFTTGRIAARIKKAFSEEIKLQHVFYHFLYNVERAGTLSGLDRFGSHDWYAEGREKILRYQFDEGYWALPKNLVDPNPNQFKASHIDDRVTSDTCAAMLFLARSTRPVIDPGVIRNLRKVIRDREETRNPKTGGSLKDVLEICRASP